MAKMNALIRLGPVYLLIAIAAGQTCYYPDKSTVSTDVACNSGDSACCPSDSFCMSNGLCFGGGLLSRGSCTDKTWNSPACASYCQSSNSSGSISLTACSSEIFSCALNTTNCLSGEQTFIISEGDNLVLRPDQAAALLQSEASGSPTSATATPTVIAPGGTCTNSNTYPASALVGLGLGLGFALLMALIVLYIVWKREKKQRPRRNSLYDPPDNDAPPVPAMPTLHAKASDTSIGRTPTITTVHSATTSASHTAITPHAPRSFLERYTPFWKPEVQEIDHGNPRYELGDTHNSRKGIQIPEMPGDYYGKDSSRY